MPMSSGSREDDCAQVILRYSDMVYRLAYSQVKDRDDADDIYQEVFLKYLRKNPRFESEEHTRRWFVRVTVNCCKNYWKTAWKRRVTSLLLPEEYLCPDEAPEEYPCPGVPEGILSSEASEYEDLLRVVKSLPEKYRVVIHLFYYEEMSVEEISRSLGRKPSTVRTQLTRARELLRRELEL